MSSNDTDQADRRERGRRIDRALEADRAEVRRTLADRADQQIPPSHGERSHNAPGVRTDERL